MTEKTTNSKEEHILYVWKVHRSAYIVPFLLIFVYGIWLFFVFYQRSKKIELTNKKFTYSYGLFSKNELSIKIEKIESVRIQKWLFDMIFWSGTIIVSGTGWNNEPITSIDNPEALKQAIENIIK